MPEQKTSPQIEPIVYEKIDLLPIIKKVWRGKKTILLCVLVGAIMGVVVTLLSPKEYTAFSVMVPQQGGDSQSKLGGLGGLAAMAGINIDMNTGSELSPMIYPQIIGSAPFQLELMNTPLNFQNYPAPITLFDYYTKYSKPSVIGTIQKYTICLPGLLINALKGKAKERSLPNNSIKYPILLTDNQYAVKKILDGILTLEVNPKLGYLTLTVRMPETIVAAQLAYNAQILLQNYITAFKIEKAKTNLEFIQGRYNEIKAEFEKAQVNLATVNDRTKSFTSGLPQIEADRIQSRYTIAYSVYQELAKQLEQAKIQVKKETPVFTIIQPVSVPNEKSKPKKTKILAICIFLWCIIGFVIVFNKQNLKFFQKKWHKAN
jgi:hypothetical protein